MTALVLTTTTFTLERKKIFGSFFTATNELLLGLVDEKLTSFQYPLAFFASIPHYRSTPLREVSISMSEMQLMEQAPTLKMSKHTIAHTHLNRDKIECNLSVPGI